MEFNKKYQDSLLKMMLLNYDFMVRCGSAIEPSYFDSNRSVIAEQILKYFRKYRVLPTERALTDLMDEVLDVSSYQKFEKIIRKTYERLWEEDYPADADYVEDKLVAFAKNQSYLNLAKSIPDFLEVSNYKEIERMYAKIQNIGINNAVVIRSKDAVKEENLGLNFEVADVIATGIPELDAPDVLGGGLAKKELGVIIAPPNVGKSMMLNHLGNAACMQGKRVYHLTLEMSADQVWKRYVSAIASISPRMIKTKMGSVKEQVGDFYEKYGGELIIDERPTKRFSPRDLDMELDRLNRIGEMPDLILIDYGDIMKSDSHYERAYEAEAEIYVDLRALCTKYGTRMWVPSQGNRDSTGKKVIEGEDIKGGFDKVATADHIISINMSKEEYQDGIARIYIPKNRRGKKNITIEIDTKYEHSRFVADIIIEANKAADEEEQRQEEVKDQETSKGKPRRKRVRKKRVTSRS